MKFSRSFTVKKDHLDEQNHVNNVVYVQWIQDIAVAHWRSAMNQEILDSYIWYLLRHEIDYKQQAFRGEEINLTTWVGKVTKVTCERLTEFKRGETLLVRATSVWCMLNVDTKKPARISKQIKERFGLDKT